MSRAMKDSHIDWIGETPQDWKTIPFRRLFEITKRLAGKTGFEVLSVTQQGIRIKDLSSNEGQMAQDYSNYQLVFPTDYVMNHMDLLTGYVDISSFTGVTSPDYRVFRARKPQEISLKYYLHIFQLCYKCKIFYHLGQGVSGLGRWRLPAKQLLLFELPLPPLGEQNVIAEFLDNKCSEIDEMIYLQEKIIDELKAYKQSVITEAVCRGLNPNVPMKDSGIEWIGHIPEEWDMVRLKNIAVFINGYAFDSEDFRLEDGVPIIRIGDITPNVNYENCLKHEYKDYMSPYRVMKGDILVAMSGNVGKISYIEEDKEAYINQRVGIIRSGDNYYLKYVLLFNGFIEHASQLNFGSVISNISSGSIMNYCFPLPSANERRKITIYLDSMCAKIDALISLKQSKIEALREYKKSIIYEYITGKKKLNG